MTTPEYNLNVREWADGLYRFALKTVGNNEEAKDVVQQAFTILWEKRTEVPPDKGKSFLFTVAYRKCMDYHRVKDRTQHADNIHENFYQNTQKTATSRKFYNKPWTG